MSDLVYEFLKNKPEFCSNIPNELKCMLCKNLMMNPSYLPCGCEYCHKCLQNYLQSNDNYCVGPRQSCRKLKVNLKDICLNPASNRRIVTLEVKCLYPSCNFTSSLEDIVDHVSTCKWGKTKCPFSMYGCINKPLDVKDVQTHMTEYSMKHSNYIILLMDNFQKSNELMKEQMNQLANENKELKMKLENNEKRVEVIQDLLKEQVSMLSIENVKLERKLNQLTEANKAGDATIRSMKQKSDNLENTVQKLMKKSKESDKSNDKGFATKPKEVKKSVPQNIVWKILKWHSTMSSIKLLLSREFYISSKHRIRLGLEYEDNAKSMCLMMQFVSGDFDRQVDWPCRSKIDIIICNNETNACITSLTFHFDQNVEEQSKFYRPLFTENEFIKKVLKTSAVEKMIDTVDLYFRFNS